MRFEDSEVQRLLSLPEAARLSGVFNDLPKRSGLYSKDPLGEVRALVEQVGEQIAGTPQLANELEALGEQISALQKSDQTQEIVTISGIVAGIAPQVMAFATGTTSAQLTATSILVIVIQVAIWFWKKRSETK